MTIIDPTAVLLEMGLSASATAEEKVIIQEATTRASGSVIDYLRYDPVQKVHTEYYPQEQTRGGRRDAIWEANSTEAYIRRETEASTSQLQLKHLPVRYADVDGSNRIDLRVDYDGRFGTKSGSFAAATQKTEGEYFWPTYDLEDSSGYGVCNDGILNSVGLWPIEPGSIKVTYLAGYTQDELAGEDSKVNASPIYETVVQEAVKRAKRALTIHKKDGRIGFLTGPFIGERLGDYSYQTDAVSARHYFGAKNDLLPESKQRLQTFTNYAGWL